MQTSKTAPKVFNTLFPPMGWVITKNNGDNDQPGVRMARLFAGDDCRCGWHVDDGEKNQLIR